MCMMGTANWTLKYVCVTPKYTCLCFRKYPKMHMCSLVKISFNLATLKYFHYLRHACVCFKSENEVCQRDCSWKGLHSCWVCTSCVSPETGRLCFRSPSWVWLQSPEGMAHSVWPRELLYVLQTHVLGTASSRGREQQTAQWRIQSPSAMFTALETLTTREI